MSTSAQSTAPSHHDDMLNAVAQARLAYAASRPRSAALHRRACGSLPNGSTRSTLSYGPFPTAMDRGEGCRLWDIDGHEYLDLCGEFTAGLFGHSETRIHAAIHEAMARGLNRGAVGEAEAELAELLCARFPSCARVRFTNSGTEANLWALTAARACPTFAWGLMDALHHAAVSAAAAGDHEESVRLRTEALGVRERLKQLAWSIT